MFNDSLLAHQVGMAFAASCLIEFLKRSKCPWFNEHSDQLNRLASLLLAALTAIGLTVKLSGSLHTGGVLTVTFPSLDQMTEATLHFLGQIGIQEAFYRGVLKRTPS